MGVGPFQRCSLAGRCHVPHGTRCPMALILHHAHCSWEGSLFLQDEGTKIRQGEDTEPVRNRLSFTRGVPWRMAVRGMWVAMGWGRVGWGSEPRSLGLHPKHALPQRKAKQTLTHSVKKHLKISTLAEALSYVPWGRREKGDTKKQF